MARVAVDVVIKSAILDPQAKAVQAALERAGHTGVRDLRVGKHFEFDVDDAVTDEQLEEIAANFLANPVMETWTITRFADAGDPQ